MTGVLVICCAYKVKGTENLDAKAHKNLCQSPRIAQLHVRSLEITDRATGVMCSL